MHNVTVRITQLGASPDEHLAFSAFSWLDGPSLLLWNDILLRPEHHLIIHSLTKGHYHCFQVLAIVKLHKYPNSGFCEFSTPLGHYLEVLSLDLMAMLAF